MLRKNYAFLWIIGGLLALFANLALANHIDTANVSADCTGFTIHVTGGDLNSPPGFVLYTITLTPTGGGGSHHDREPED